MTNLQIIERQHEIIHAQNDIIRAQAQALAQVGAMVMEEERAAAWEKYEALLGVNEWPEPLPKSPEKEEPT